MLPAPVGANCGQYSAEIKSRGSRKVVRVEAKCR